MKGIVRRRDRARQDLIDIYRYLAREAGLRTAARATHIVRWNKRRWAQDTSLVTIRTFVCQKHCPQFAPIWGGAIQERRCFVPRAWLRAADFGPH
jgi:hypothetical protein